MVTTEKEMLPADWIKQIKTAYPKRAIGCSYEWPKAIQQMQQRMREGHSFDDLLEGAKNYCLAAKQCGNYGSEYVKQASTFFGPGLHFLDEFEVGEEFVPRQPEVVTNEMKVEDQRLFDEQIERFKNKGRS